MASESYERMADALFESNWQSFPSHLQKYLIVFIANAQKPIFFHGFGIAILNLQTFNKVRDDLSSFFLSLD